MPLPFHDSQVSQAGRSCTRTGCDTHSLLQLWAFATLSYLPEDGLLDQIAEHAAAIISTFR